tara:strand:- start:58542 stop:68237 length:9696 start_codon:yes stop_codon:yes gene_type:complete
VKYSRRILIIPDADITPDVVKSASVVSDAGGSSVLADAQKKRSVSQPIRGARYRHYQRENIIDNVAAGRARSVTMVLNRLGDSAGSSDTKLFRDDSIQQYVSRPREAHQFDPSTAFGARGEGELVPRTSGEPSADFKGNAFITSSGGVGGARFSWNTASESRGGHKVPGDTQFRQSPNVFGKYASVLHTTEGSSSPGGANLTSDSSFSSADPNCRYLCRPKAVELENGEILCFYLSTSLPPHHWQLSSNRSLTENTVSTKSPALKCKAFVQRRNSDGVWQPPIELTNDSQYPGLLLSSHDEYSTEEIAFIDAVIEPVTGDVICFIGKNTPEVQSEDLFVRSVYNGSHNSDASISVSSFGSAKVARSRSIVTITSTDNGMSWQKRSESSMESDGAGVGTSAVTSGVPGMPSSDIGLILGGSCEIMDSGRIVLSLVTGEAVYLVSTDDLGFTFRCSLAREIAVGSDGMSAEGISARPPEEGLKDGDTYIVDSVEMKSIHGIFNTNPAPRGVFQNFNMTSPDGRHFYAGDNVSPLGWDLVVEEMRNEPPTLEEIEANPGAIGKLRNAIYSKVYAIGDNPTGAWSEFAGCFTICCFNNADTTSFDNGRVSFGFCEYLGVSLGTTFGSGGNVTVNRIANGGWHRAIPISVSSPNGDSDTDFPAAQAQPWDCTVDAGFSTDGLPWRWFIVRPGGGFAFRRDAADTSFGTTAIDDRTGFATPTPGRYFFVKNGKYAGRRIFIEGEAERDESLEEVREVPTQLTAGERYLVGPFGSGDFGNKFGAIAQYDGSSWSYSINNTRFTPDGYGIVIVGNSPFDTDDFATRENQIALLATGFTRDATIDDLGGVQLMETCVGSWSRFSDPVDGQVIVVSNVQGQPEPAMGSTNSYRDPSESRTRAQASEVASTIPMVCVDGVWVEDDTLGEFAARGGEIAVYDESASKFVFEKPLEGQFVRIKGEGLYKYDAGRNVWNLVENEESDVDLALSRRTKCRETIANTSMTKSDSGQVFFAVSFTDFNDTSPINSMTNIYIQDELLGTDISSRNITGDATFVYPFYMEDPREISVEYASRRLEVFETTDGESCVLVDGWVNSVNVEDRMAYASNKAGYDGELRYNVRYGSVVGVDEELPYGPCVIEPCIVIRPDGFLQIYGASHNWLPPQYEGLQNDTNLNSGYISSVSGTKGGSGFESMHAAVINGIASATIDVSSSVGSMHPSVNSVTEKNAVATDLEYRDDQFASAAIAISENGLKEDDSVSGSNSDSLTNNHLRIKSHMRRFDSRRATAAFMCSPISSGLGKGLISPGKITIRGANAISYRLSFMWGLFPETVSSYRTASVTPSHYGAATTCVAHSRTEKLSSDVLGGIDFVVRDRVTSPPNKISVGDLFLVKPNATGVFLGKDNNIACYEVKSDGTLGWTFRDRFSSDQKLIISGAPFGLNNQHAVFKSTITSASSGANISSWVLTSTYALYDLEGGVYNNVQIQHDGFSQEVYWYADGAGRATQLPASQFAGFIGGYSGLDAISTGNEMLVVSSKIYQQSLGNATPMRIRIRPQLGETIPSAFCSVLVSSSVGGEEVLVYLNGKFLFSGVTRAGVFNPHTTGIHVDVNDTSSVCPVSLTGIESGLEVFLRSGTSGVVPSSATGDSFVSGEVEVIKYFGGVRRFSRPLSGYDQVDELGSPFPMRMADSSSITSNRSFYWHPIRENLGRTDAASSVGGHCHWEETVMSDGKYINHPSIEQASPDILDAYQRRFRLIGGRYYALNFFGDSSPTSAGFDVIKGKDGSSHSGGISIVDAGNPFGDDMVDLFQSNVSQSRPQLSGGSDFTISDIKQSNRFAIEAPSGANETDVKTFDTFSVGGTVRTITVGPTHNQAIVPGTISSIVIVEVTSSSPYFAGYALDGTSSRVQITGILKSSAVNAGVLASQIKRRDALRLTETGPLFEIAEAFAFGDSVFSLIVDKAYVALSLGGVTSQALAPNVLNLTTTPSDVDPIHVLPTMEVDYGNTPSISLTNHDITVPIESAEVAPTFGSYTALSGFTIDPNGRTNLNSSTTTEIHYSAAPASTTLPSLGVIKITGTNVTTQGGSTVTKTRSVAYRLADNQQELSTSGGVIELVADDPFVQTESSEQVPMDDGSVNLLPNTLLYFDSNNDGSSDITTVEFASLTLEASGTLLSAGRIAVDASSLTVSSAIVGYYIVPRLPSGTSSNRFYKITAISSSFTNSIVVSLTSTNGDLLTSEQKGFSFDLYKTTTVNEISKLSSANGGALLFTKTGSYSTVSVGLRKNGDGGQHGTRLPFPKGYGCSPVHSNLAKTHHADPFAGGFRAIFAPYHGVGDVFDSSTSGIDDKIFFSLMLQGSGWDIPNSCGVILKAMVDETTPNNKVILELIDGVQLFDLSALEEPTVLGRVEIDFSPASTDSDTRPLDLKFVEVLVGMESAINVSDPSGQPQASIVHAFARAVSPSGDSHGSFHTICNYKRLQHGPTFSRKLIADRQSQDIDAGMEHFLFGVSHHGLSSLSTDTSVTTNLGMAVKQVSVHRPGSRISGSGLTAINCDLDRRVETITGPIYDKRAYGTQFTEIDGIQVTTGSDPNFSVGDIFTRGENLSLQACGINPTSLTEDGDSCVDLMGLPFFDGSFGTRLSLVDAGVVNPNRTGKCSPFDQEIASGINISWSGSTASKSCYSIETYYHYAFSNSFEQNLSKVWMTGTPPENTDMQAKFKSGKESTGRSYRSRSPVYTVPSIEVVLDSQGDSGDAASGDLVMDVEHQIRSRKNFVPDGIAVFGRNWPSCKIEFCDSEEFSDSSSSYRCYKIGQPGDSWALSPASNSLSDDPERYTHLWAWTNRTDERPSPNRSPVADPSSGAHVKFGDRTFSYMVDSSSFLASAPKAAWHPHQFRSAGTSGNYYLQVIGRRLSTGPNAGTSNRFVFKIIDNTEYTLILDSNPLKVFDESPSTDATSGVSSSMPWHTVSIYSDRFAMQLYNWNNSTAAQSAAQGKTTSQSHHLPGVGFRYMKITINGCSRLVQEESHSSLGRIVLGEVKNLAAPDFEWGWSRSEMSGTNLTTYSGGQRVAKKLHEPRRKFQVSHAPLMPKDRYNVGDRSPWESVSRGPNHVSVDAEGYRHTKRTWQEILDLFRKMGMGSVQAALIFDDASNALTCSVEGHAYESHSGYSESSSHHISTVTVPSDPQSLMLVRLVSVGELGHEGYVCKDVLVQKESSISDLPLPASPFGSVVSRPAPVFSIASITFEEDL